jgi:hypothetical protein
MGDVIKDEGKQKHLAEYEFKIFFCMLLLVPRIASRSVVVFNDTY